MTTTTMGTDPTDLTVGERIRWARKRVGLSQVRFAEKLGTSQRHVVRWEKNEHRPGPEYAEAIARITSQPVSLFTEDGSTEDDEDDESG